MFINVLHQKAAVQNSGDSYGSQLFFDRPVRFHAAPRAFVPTAAVLPFATKDADDDADDDDAAGDGGADGHVLFCFAGTSSCPRIVRSRFLV